MAAIRNKNTQPEVAVRRGLHAAGLRFRLHAKDLPGKPDIVFPSRRIAVFVHGCFWHHHGCANSVWPRVRAGFWRRKIQGNIDRDARNRAALEQLGWRSVIVWECDVRRSASTITRLARKIGRSRTKT